MTGRPADRQASRAADSDDTECRAAERGRGRRADAPTDIPARGWKDILLRVYGNVFEHRVIPIAAGVTYFALLAIFPGLAALVSIFGLLSDPASLSGQLEALSDVVPEGAMNLIRDQLTRLVDSGNRTLGLTFAGSLLVSLWTANAGVKATFDALNVVYGETEKRGILKRTAISYGWTCAAVAFLAVAFATIILLPIALDYLGLGTITARAVDLARWPILLLVVGTMLAVVYRFGPSRENPRWRWVTLGSAFAALTWLLGSVLFSWYTDNFGNYNKTYGSLGAVIGFMVWIWLSTIVVLLGAELDAEMEHQTARDSTTGPPQPLGERGARVADTVGEAH